MPVGLSGRRTRRVLLSIALGAVAGPAALLAHTALKSSSPANGAHLSEVPRLLRLEFTETIELATARVVLRKASGDTVEISALRHEDGAPRVVLADVTGAPDSGAHVIEWVIAGKDGHAVRGTIAFSIDSGAIGLRMAVTDTMMNVPDTAAALPPPGAASGFQSGTTDATSPVYTLVRFLTYVGILGLIGVAVLGSVVIPRARGLDERARDVVVRRSGRLGQASALALLLAGLARLGLQTAALSGVGWSTSMAAQILRHTTWGTAWLMQVAAAVVALFVLRVRSRGGQAVGWLLLAACGVIALSASLSGHPVAAPNAWLAVPFDTLHVLAVGSWLGTLLVMTLAVFPTSALVLPEGKWAMARSLFASFSPLALVCGGAVLVTGAAGAWMQLGGLMPHFESGYGRILLVKLGALAAVASAGLYKWRLVVPRLGTESGTSRLRGSAAVELSLAAIILLVTAVLTATTPPVGGS